MKFIDHWSVDHSDDDRKRITLINLKQPQPANVHGLRDHAIELGTQKVVLEELFLKCGEKIQELDEALSARQNSLNRLDARAVRLQDDLMATRKAFRMHKRRCDSELSQIQNERNLNIQTIQSQKDKEKALIMQHKQELSRAAQENRDLHAAIIESGQESDPFDDQQLAAKFRALEGKLHHLVKRHFPATRKTTGWKEYDNIRAQDDRELFLQAHIATVIAQEFFGHDARLFGLDEATEKSHAAFEKLLLEKNGKHEKRP